MILDTDSDISITLYLPVSDMEISYPLVSDNFGYGCRSFRELLRRQVEILSTRDAWN